MVNRSYKTAKGTDLPLLNLRGKEYLEVKYRLVWFREEHPDWSVETDLMNVTDSSAYAKATVRDENGRVIATSHKFESVQGFPDFIEKAETGAIGRALALIGYGTQFCADELDEGSRIVDAPAQRPQSRAGQSNVQSAPVQKSSAKPSGRKIEPDAVRPVVIAAEESEQDQEAQESTAEQKTDQETEEGPPERTADPGEYRISFGRKYKGKKLREIPKSELKGYINWLENSGVRPGTTLSHQLQFLKNAYEQLYKAPEASH